MSFEDLNNRIISCKLCPRLVKYREEVAKNPPKRFRGQTYWAKPLPGFGDVGARVLVLGLAPAAHGGNRTGRMFTGDSSGDTLVRALHRAGFANMGRSISINDGLVLKDVYITAVVRCAPPDNKPAKQEVENCLPYLIEELRMLENVVVVVALGRFAFETFFRLMRRMNAYSGRIPRFRHGAIYRLNGSFNRKPLPTVIASYHPSRQNTSTGRLTQRMIDSVFHRARAIAGL